MDGVLSQEEINALLNNNDAADSSDEILTESEKDAIGEIANISMGTAATTLFSLVNRRDFYSCCFFFKLGQNC